MWWPHPTAFCQLYDWNLALRSYGEAQKLANKPSGAGLQAPQRRLQESWQAPRYWNNVAHCPHSELVQIWGRTHDPWRAWPLGTSELGEYRTSSRRRRYIWVMYLFPAVTNTWTNISVLSLNGTWLHSSTSHNSLTFKHLYLQLRSRHAATIHFRWMLFIFGGLTVQHRPYAAQHHAHQCYVDEFRRLGHPGLRYTKPSRRK